MSNIEALRDKARAANAALYAAQRLECDKENAALVGSCFKFRNSGGGCEGHWYLYAKITRVDNEALRSFQFQRYPDGRIEIETDRYHTSSAFRDGSWREIDLREYEEAWNVFHRYIVELIP